MRKKYELLAPAGTFEALQAAVQNRADAVYLAGKDFGARQFAGNFSREELQESVIYCHVRGVSVYVTVNTLVLNQELEALREYIDFLYIIGVDAVIVQDIGVLSYIRKHYPDLDIHCSTQMSVQRVEDIKYLESLGVKRVVLGREMTIQQVRQAKKETNVDLEVFVHGALCISLSGQCLMSSMIGGRSGNRGRCAQPCRQQYTLYNEDTGETVTSLHGDYLLSPKDLSTLEDINAVIEAGAYSLKIEGRMKKPAYVAKVVQAYRQALSAYDQQEPSDMKNSEKALTIFNRGFTEGHLFQDRGLDLMSMKSPGNQGYLLGKVKAYDAATSKVTLVLSEDLHHNDEMQVRQNTGIIGGRVERLEHRDKLVKTCSKGENCQVNWKHHCQPGEWVYKTYDQAIMKEAKESYHKEFLTLGVSMEVNIQHEKPVRGKITDGTHVVEQVSRGIPQKAINRRISAEDVKKQMSKMGGTPYVVTDMHINLDDGLAIPMKELNELRRVLVDGLNEKRANRYKRSPIFSGDKESNKAPAPGIARQLTFTYATGRLDQLDRLIDMQGEVIYWKGTDQLMAALSLAQEKGFKGQLIPEIHRMHTDASLKKYAHSIQQTGLDTVLIQHVGQVNLFSDFHMVGDYHLNVVNDLSYAFYENRNFQRTTLSPELNYSQMAVMKTLWEKTEIVGYGSLPVMAMKHCVMGTLLGQGKNCQLCQLHHYSLVDGKEAHFPIRKIDGCSTEVYNAKKLMLIEDHERLGKAGIGYFRLNFLDETPEEVEQVVTFHRQFISNTLTSEDEKNIQHIKAQGVTKGHLHRGIE